MAYRKRKMIIGCGLAMPLLNACVHWSGGAEHYWGPVFYRYVTPHEGHAYVGQVISLGLWAESGAQWGMTFGASNRVTVDPIAVSVKKGNLVGRNYWRAPLSITTSETGGNWRFSPMHLSIEREEQDYFSSRTLEGIELVFGKKTNAFTVGYARDTLFTPPPDALAKLRFQDDRPLAAEATVWLDITDPGEISANLVNEAAQ